jgi:methyl-accepting chemotaxis protein
MNQTPESAGRDLFAEIDEIVNTMQAVLKAVANMGEEVIRYRRSWSETAEQLTVLTAALNGGIERQTELNEVFSKTMTESVKVATSLDERISEVESGCIVPLANAIASFEERLSALENGHRLILP